MSLGGYKDRDREERLASIIYVLWKCVALKKAVDFPKSEHLLRASVLGHSFGSFAHGMLREFSWQQKTNGSLHFARRNGPLLIVMRQSWRFASNSFEDIVHERIHDAHRLARDTNIGMDLFQNFVDVDTVSLLPGSSPLRLRFGSLSLSTFSSFLCRALFRRTLLRRTSLRACLSRAPGWTWLATGTHFLLKSSVAHVRSRTQKIQDWCDAKISASYLLLAVGSSSIRSNVFSIFRTSQTKGWKKMKRIFYSRYCSLRIGPICFFKVSLNGADFPALFLRI